MSGNTAKIKELSLYIHVPFCLAKCAYCNFFSLPAVNQSTINSWLVAVGKQIELISQRKELKEYPYKVKTVFFGGGTPSVLNPEQLIFLLDRCLRNFAHLPVDEMEISLEANPATLDSYSLQTLVKAGFNRISVGVQSLIDSELKAIGRPHTAREVQETINNIKQAGFTNLSLDLMYGLPSQSSHSWQQSLEQALSLSPSHLSLYELTMEPGTPLHASWQKNELALPSEDVILKMLGYTLLITNQAGLHRYEISNYARKGQECSHNLTYWHNGDYLGFGPGAVATLGLHRYRTGADLGEYQKMIARGDDCWQLEELLSREEKFRETVMMGLRLTRGLNLASLQERFGINLQEYYGDRIERLQTEGLLILTGDRLFLSERGLMLANRVMAELI